MSHLILKFIRSCGHHFLKTFWSSLSLSLYLFFSLFFSFFFCQLYLYRCRPSPNKLKSISFVIMHITCYIDIIHTYDRFSSEESRIYRSLCPHCTSHCIPSFVGSFFYTSQHFSCMCAYITGCFVVAGLLKKQFFNNTRYLLKVKFKEIKNIMHIIYYNVIEHINKYMNEDM